MSMARAPWMTMAGTPATMQQWPGRLAAPRGLDAWLHARLGRGRTQGLGRGNRSSWGAAGAQRINSLERDLDPHFSLA